MKGVPGNTGNTGNYVEVPCCEQCSEKVHLTTRDYSQRGGIHCRSTVDDKSHFLWASCLEESLSCNLVNRGIPRLVPQRSSRPFVVSKYLYGVVSSFHYYEMHCKQLHHPEWAVYTTMLMEKLREATGSKPLSALNTHRLSILVLSWVCNFCPRSGIFVNRQTLAHNI